MKELLTDDYIERIKIFKDAEMISKKQASKLVCRLLEAEQNLKNAIDEQALAKIVRDVIGAKEQHDKQVDDKLLDTLKGFNEPDEVWTDYAYGSPEWDIVDKRLNLRGRGSGMAKAPVRIGREMRELVQDILMMDQIDKAREDNVESNILKEATKTKGNKSIEHTVKALRKVMNKTISVDHNLLAASIKAGIDLRQFVAAAKAEDEKCK